MLFNIRIDKVYDLHVHVKITMDDGVKLNGWIQIYGKHYFKWFEKPYHDLRSIVDEYFRNTYCIWLSRIIRDHPATGINRDCIADYKIIGYTYSKPNDVCEIELKQYRDYMQYKKGDRMQFEFFIPLEKVPTCTHQQKRVTVKNGTPRFYESHDVKETRALFTSRLAPHRPEVPLEGPIRLVTKWCFGKQKCAAPEWKITKPDTDNLIKLFKDCMTTLHYLHDDAQVCSEITEKYWNPVTGIWVHIETLGDVI